MAKKIAKKEAPKKAAPKKVEKKMAKKPEPKKVEKKAVKIDKKSEKKPEKKAPASKKPEPKKIEKKAAPAPKKPVTVAKPSKKEEKKPLKAAPKVEIKKKPEVKKPEPKLDKKVQPKKNEKVEKLDKKAKAQLAKEEEKKQKEAAKLAAKEAAKDAKLKEQEEKKGKKAKPQEVEEAPKKAGRPAKEASTDDDLVGADDGDWEEEDIDLEEIESEKRNFSIDDELKDNLVGDILSRADGDSLKDIFTSIRDPQFFSSGVDECIERNCDSPATTANFCRLHYIKNWNDIKKKLQILTDGKLQELIEVLVSKYPVKYIEAILQDLSEEKVFLSVLKELNIESVEESFDDDLEDGDDDSDIAFETKATFKGGALGEED